MSRKLRARVGWWVGWLAVAAGVFLTVGLGPALVVSGLVIALSFLLLYDVDEEGTVREPAPSIPPPL